MNLSSRSLKKTTRVSSGCAHGYGTLLHPAFMRLFHHYKAERGDNRKTDRTEKQKENITGSRELSSRVINKLTSNKSCGRFEGQKLDGA